MPKHKMRHYWLFLFLLLSTILTACASKQQQRFDTLNDLKDLGATAFKQTRDSMSAIRRTALQDTAMSLGARAGLAAKAISINNNLQRQTRYLDQVFNFNAMLLDEHVLPPVLLEARRTLNLGSSTSIRLADRVYKIEKQARFVTTPPTWRSYLWLDYEKPEQPDNTLLPRNSTERKIWNTYVAQGWESGQRQANTIFTENLARLKQDYQGMILYRKLLALNMVTRPYVARTKLGVTGDRSEVHIDDQVLRISAMPELKPDSGTWRAIVADAHKSQQSSETAYENMMASVRSGKNKLPEQSSSKTKKDSWQSIVHH